MTVMFFFYLFFFIYFLCVYAMYSISFNVFLFTLLFTFQPFFLESAKSTAAASLIHTI